ncbi:head-tail connector protein [Escherichia coli]|uniref:head-tail connector protein n=1 Tax=Escherichia coli TaxID=562 RepID=UPI001F28D48E|nr:head-tail connector protein [Escherichia coli]
MTELITLEEVKLHCRIDGDEEDQLISGYIAASLEACQIHIGRRFDDGLEFTPAIKIGCMMFIAHLYENRQIVTDNAKTRVPMTIGALWTAYRDVGVY